MAIGGLPVTAVTKFGIAVTQAAAPFGLPVTVALNGLAVTPVASGGMPVFDLSGTLFGPAVIPGNTGLPVISGSTITGQVLSCSLGMWSGTLATYTFQWKRGGVNISGATSNLYTLVTADLAAMISCTVTATNTAGSASATATAVGPVTIAAPINSAIPVISGSTVQGDVLTTTNGTWTGSPTFTYQWKRGVTNVGTNSTTYTTVSGDVGSTITVTVTATNAGGNASATSAGVGPITAAVGGSLATPTLTSLTTATDTGASSTDLITNDTTPDLNVDWGADAPLTGDVIEVSNNGTLIVTHTVTADEAGSGVLVLDFPLSEGSNSLTVTHKRGISSSSPSGALVVVIDTIAPTLASPTGAQVLQTTAALTVSTNDATGTLYYVVTASATPPSKAQIKAGQDNAGAAAIYAGSQVVVTAGGKTATATGLNTNGTRYAYYMHEDIAGNQSAVSSATWAQVNLSAGGVLTYKAGPTAQTGTTASFTAIPIGAAAADRIVVVCMKAAFNTGNTLTVTLNSGAVTSSGIAQDNGNQYINIFYKLVPTGTTCQVDVTCTGTAANMGQCQIAVYTITGCQFAHSGSGSTAWDVTFASMGVTATVPTDGVAVAAFGTDRVTTGTWSGNATLDLAVSGPVTEELIALSVRSLTGAQTVTKTPNPTNYAAVMLCWGP